MQGINKRSANTASVHQYALLGANSPDKSNVCFYVFKVSNHMLETFEPRSVSYQAEAHLKIFVSIK